MADEHFQAVVVGSGFGGSVMACRLAEGGMTVCVLERGKKYPPGTFARTPYEMRNNFWRPHKKTFGLFDVWSFANMEAVVSAGVGGGSLIYANVLIRKDENWFVRDGRPGAGHEYWPVDRAELDPHYERAEKMLGGNVYPAWYQEDNKTAAMRRAAHWLDIPETTHDRVDPKRAQFYLPLLAISFSQQGDPPGMPIPGSEANLHGRLRETCRLCGECDVGCNYGAKNTLDYTYLTRAESKGAEIRDLCEVETIAPLRNGRGYEILYVVHDPKERRTDRRHPKRITADNLILACGTFGTNLLLLRNRQHFGPLRKSKALGRQVCGNGDYLAFAIDCTKYGERPARIPQRMNASRAPVITSTFRFPDTLDRGEERGRGAYLQDAGYPLAGDYLWEATRPVAIVWRVLRFLYDWVFRGTRTRMGGLIQNMIGDAARSSTSMPMLGMGRDVPDGRLSLKRRRLQLAWSDEASKPHYKRIDRKARDVAGMLGGRYCQNPLTQLFNREITVHALGGCSMGRNAAEGVVDSYGRVFDCPGLYVADGSVMPGPVGANPSLTIAALAERFAQQLLEDWKKKCGR